MDTDPESLVLTILDTSGIQAYIFGTNNLRQSVGASGLVRWATQDAALETLRDVCGAEGVNITADGTIIADRYLAFPPTGEAPTPGLKAEWLNAGGGNTLLLFQTRALAEKFTRKLSLKLMQEAPGLTLVAAHVDVQPNDPLTEKVDEAIKAVNRKKQNRSWSAPLLGLSVTATCQYTGLPASVEYAEESSPDELLRISPEVHHKRKFFGAAQDHLQHQLSSILGEHYVLLRDFDQLGIKGEASFMGVVHIDGNGMGQRVQKIVEGFTTVSHNRKYIEALRALSHSIEVASEKALRQTVQALTNKFESDAEEHRKLTREGDKLVLPFRPIVFGGDDITFVCDGRHALSLAQFYLQKLEEQELSDKKPLFVRGGVAIVNSHYPFARAYELAEELAKSTKKLINKHCGEDKSCSALDWHFATTGLVLDLEQTRRREYTLKSTGDLTMRPILIRQYDGVTEWRKWDYFIALVDKFNQKPWAEKRNKIKALREILRQGPKHTTRFIRTYGKDHHLPAPEGYQGADKSGWVDDRCAWADAIEMLDLYSSITPQPKPMGANVD